MTFIQSVLHVWFFWSVDFNRVKLKSSDSTEKLKVKSTSEFFFCLFHKVKLSSCHREEPLSSAHTWQQPCFTCRAEVWTTAGWSQSSQLAVWSPAVVKEGAQQQQTELHKQRREQEPKICCAAHLKESLLKTSLHFISNFTTSWQCFTGSVRSSSSSMEAVDAVFGMWAGAVVVSLSRKVVGSNSAGASLWVCVLPQVKHALVTWTADLHWPQGPTWEQSSLKGPESQTVCDPAGTKLTDSCCPVTVRLNMLMDRLRLTRVSEHQSS